MSGGNLQVVELPSHFSQLQLVGLKAIVDHHVVDGDPVQFDAENLDRIDGAAVQFLVAVSQLQIAAGNDGVMVVNSNDVLANALSDMSVSNLLKTDANDGVKPEASTVNE